MNRFSGRKIPRLRLPLVDKLHILNIADVHFGSIMTDYNRFEELVNYVDKHKHNTYFTIGGDICDFVDDTDYRWNSVPGDIVIPKYLKAKDIVSAELSDFAKIIEPIMGNCIGAVYGNHEEARQAEGWAPLVKTLIDWTAPKNYKWGKEIPYLGANGLVELVFYDPKTNKNIGSIIYYLSHYPPARTISLSSLINKMIMFGRKSIADIFMYGHYHKKIIATDRHMEKVGSKEVMKKKIHAMTGTFLMTYDIYNTDNYAKIAMFDQPDPGVTKITVVKNKDNMLSLHASI